MTSGSFGLELLPLTTWLLIGQYTTLNVHVSS